MATRGTAASGIFAIDAKSSDKKWTGTPKDPRELLKKKKSYSVTDGKVHKYRIDFIVNKKLKNAQLRLNDT